MDKNQALLWESNLYADSVLNNIAASQTKWILMSDREKELLARHLTCCILLCNLEEEEEINPKKRKTNPVPVEKEKKKRKVRELPPQPSTSREPDEPHEDVPDSASKSSSSGDTSTISKEEDQVYGLEDNANYRFVIIKYMSAPQHLTQVLCAKWGCEPPTEIWDIADKRNRILLNLEITSDFKKAKDKYMHMRSCCPFESSMLVVNPYDMTHELYGAQIEIKTIPKIKSFLLKRKMIVDSLGIIETEIQNKSDISKEIFVSRWFLEGMLKWVNDWNKEAYVSWPVEKLYPGTLKYPTTISPKVLLECLSDLNESERNKTITWRGKLLPEGWGYNLIGNWETDREMVDAVIQLLLEEISNEEMGIDKIGGYQCEDGIGLLRSITECWEMNQRSNTFVQYIPSRENKFPLLSTALGHKKRKRKYNPYASNLKQKEEVPMPKCRYHTYFEEIVRRMNISPLTGNQTCFGELMNEPINLEHPVSKITEPITTELLKIMSQSNSAILSSKITNMYSRIGGAYSGGTKRHNSMRSGVAIFPIYANISELKDQGPVPLEKWLSGIILRGANHSKNPTDRIPIITLEILLNTPENRFIVKQMNKGISYTTKTYIFLLRPNSIMKEDTSYLTFVNTSLFSPCNMFGLLTIENDMVPQDCNMIEFSKDLLSKSPNWFLERYTEGVLMAVIGNSRDEGYFAHLRKLFMVLFSWKLNHSVANWDITSFCKKVNDCLVENALSMHFHVHLLQIIQDYCE